MASPPRSEERGLRRLGGKRMENKHEEVEKKVKTKAKSNVPLILLLSWFCAGVLVLAYHKFTVVPELDNLKLMQAEIQKKESRVACLDIDKLITETMVEYAKKKGGVTAEDTAKLTKAVRDELANYKNANLVLAKNVVLKGCTDITENITMAVKKVLEGGVK